MLEIQPRKGCVTLCTLLSAAGDCPAAAMTVDFTGNMPADVATSHQQPVLVQEFASKTAIARSPVLRLRGLPFLATTLDVKEFFSGFDLSDVYICRRNGGCFSLLVWLGLSLATRQEHKDSLLYVEWACQGLGSVACAGHSSRQLPSWSLLPSLTSTSTPAQVLHPGCCCQQHKSSSFGR